VTGIRYLLADVVDVVWIHTDLLIDLARATIGPSLERQQDRVPSTDHSGALPVIESAEEECSPFAF
jgi:hypothetical protein